jgi:hypothetical protein
VFVSFFVCVRQEAAVQIQSAATVCACRGSRLTMQGTGQQEQEACLVGRGGGGLGVCLGWLWLVVALPVLVGYVVVHAPLVRWACLLRTTRHHAGAAPGWRGGGQTWQEALQHRHAARRAQAQDAEPVYAYTLPRRPQARQAVSLARQ